MVNSNKPMKNPVLPPGLQDSYQCVGESGDSPNLLSRASSRVQTCHIAKHSLSAFSASRNASPKALALSSLGESEKEDMGSDCR